MSDSPKIRVNKDFKVKLTDISKETGLSIPTITRYLANDIDGLDIKIKKRSFRVFK